jgi:hypothetical protein
MENIFLGYGSVPSQNNKMPRNTYALSLFYLRQQLKGVPAIESCPAAFFCCCHQNQ